MVVLFVHGMGRTPISGWPLLRRLRQAGMKTGTFVYVSAFEDFDSIVTRLKNRIERLAATGSYIVVGHSLGGLLLRAALNALSDGTALPRHVYLLGSPILPSRLAIKLKRNLIFRALAGDCGQLLGSPERMSSIAPLDVPTTGIAGVRGFLSHASFGQEINDGVVSISEVSAAWLSTQVCVPVVHTLLPSSSVVADVIMAGLERNAG
jgi:pimeloyl-ACP methyl ester carboxylesterase